MIGSTLGRLVASLVLTPVALRGSHVGLDMAEWVVLTAGLTAVAGSLFLVPMVSGALSALAAFTALFAGQLITLGVPILVSPSTGGIGVYGGPAGMQLYVAMWAAGLGVSCMVATAFCRSMTAR